MDDGYGGALARPNPNLRPERALNVEIGVNVLRDALLFSDDHLRQKVLRFDNHNTDYVIRTERKKRVCTDGACRSERSPAPPGPSYYK